MKLYRNISCIELLSLLENNFIEGQFSYENCHSGYKKELGPVVCCFKEPICFGPQYDFIIELEVDVDEVLGEGIMKWEMIDSYDVYYLWSAPEVYIRQYSRDQVKNIWDLDRFLVSRAFAICDKIFIIKKRFGWEHPSESKDIFGAPRKDFHWLPEKVEDYIHFIDRVDEKWILKRTYNHLIDSVDEYERAVLLLLKRHLEFLKSIPPAIGEQFYSNTDDRFLIMCDDDCDED